MAKKFCEKCYDPTEMSNFECRKCGGSSFIHALPTGDYCDCGIPEVSGTACAKCNKEINPSRLAKISLNSPFTASKPAPVLKGEKEKGRGAVATLQVSPTGKTIDDLIRAQNRTTHAVRAFVRFLFIQLSAMTLGVFIWNLSLGMADAESCAYDGTNCDGNSALQVIAGLVVLGGIIWSSSAGWSELEKSNVN